MLPYCGGIAAGAGQYRSAAGLVSVSGEGELDKLPPLPLDGEPP